MPGKGYPPPLTHEQSFEGGMNSDLADELMRKNTGRFFLNCSATSTSDGQLGQVTNVLGNIMVTTPLADGVNKTLGSAEDEKNNKFYFIVYNSNGFHTWYVYDALLNIVSVILQSKTDTGGVDILRLNPNYPVLHIDIVTGTGDTVDYTLLYWCDAFNKGRKTNIQKCMDKTTAGYGYVIQEDYITAYKKAPYYAPIVANAVGVSGYFTDLTRNSNFLYGQLFKFCYRWVYDDGEISNYSDWSPVALPTNQNYQGQASITNDNNCIIVGINTGSPLVKKIEIAMLTSGVQTVNGAVVQGATLKWQTVEILNKVQLGISDNSSYGFYFYNDGSYTVADQDKINRPYSFMFRRPTCQAFVKDAMTYTGGDEAFPVVNVNVSVAMKFQALYLPPETENKLNSPIFTIVQESYTTQSELFSVVRYNPVILVTIGPDVKAGNFFFLSAANAGSDRYEAWWTATAADTSVSISNKIASYLRGIGRGLVTSQSVDIDGNATFIFSYLGQYGANITTFTGSVTPVYYATLKNIGPSIQVIKSGSVRQYAFAYDDDDGRTSNGYTSASCIIRTPFLTESPGGVLQQPIHAISIMHQPPVWAKNWRLLRTPDELNYIQMLIQQIIDVTVISDIDNGEYLDLVIGSLITYNAIHADSVLSYQFTRGDRVRLIRNQTSGAYYTPFFETEIISYNEVTTEFRNAAIVVNPGGISGGNDHVTPKDGVIASYVGKNIQIAGYERTIVSISGADYVLDNTLNIGPNAVEALVGSYNFIDRRGIIRIAKPPAGYTVVDLSTVEVYTPQKVTDNLDFKIFNDTAQKFEIANYGTDTRAHRGTTQDQDGTSQSSLVNTPAIVLVTEGDAYIRYRELPTNNSLVDTEIKIDTIEDPNFSDFYPSSLNNLGRVYPKDDGTGQKYFGSRTRFSNNYITDTSINGLNDFDNLDRVDNDDAYGDVSLTKFRENKLHLFKKLKDCWLPVGQNIINTPDGQAIIGLSDKLLGPIQYYQYDGGIGDNPESWFETESAMYHAVPGRGTIVRVAGDGVDPISTEFGYDSFVRGVLASVKKFSLRIFGGYDIKNGNGWWSVPAYIPPIFNNPFNSGDWNTLESALPDGAVPVIVTQPANGVVTYDSGADNFIIDMNDNFVGTDTFTYKFSLPGGGFSPIKNACIVSVKNPNTTISYRVKTSTVYCTQLDGGNDGNQSWTTLEAYFIVGGAVSGNIMPNVKMISPQAIVPSSATITYNETTSPAPSGGINGDIWYNEPTDELYKKIVGAWTLLTDRVINLYYVSPVQNLVACPLPTPPPETIVLTAHLLSFDPVIGEAHFDFETDMSTGVGPINVNYSVDYEQNGNLFHVIVNENTAIQNGDTASPDINFVFDPSSTVTLIIFTFTPTPNPLPDSSIIDYSSSPTPIAP